MKGMRKESPLVNTNEERSLITCGRTIQTLIELLHSVQQQIFFEVKPDFHLKEQHYYSVSVLLKSFDIPDTLSTQGRNSNEQQQKHY